MELQLLIHVVSALAAQQDCRLPRDKIATVFAAAVLSPMNVEFAWAETLVRVQALVKIAQESAMEQQVLTVVAFAQAERQGTLLTQIRMYAEFALAMVLHVLEHAYRMKWYPSR